MRSPWFYYRFFAYDPFAVQYLKFVQGIVDLPMTGGQLYRILALILYGNGIAKSKMHFVIFEKCTFKTGVYRYFDSFGYLCCHKVRFYYKFIPGGEALLL